MEILDKTDIPSCTKLQLISNNGIVTLSAVAGTPAPQTTLLSVCQQNFMHIHFE